MMWLDYLYYLLLAVLTGYLLMTGMMFVVLAKKKSGERKAESEQLFVEPKVSVLIAARNEEGNIIRCLKALVDQDYPAANIQNPCR